MKKFFVLLLPVFAVIGCSDRPTLENPTDEFLPGQRLAELTGKKLDEISGIAASINNPGMMWAHNDSQNGTEVFLLDDKLNIGMTCELMGIENRDWEDIAVGPGPVDGKNYVYVGEIGDNSAKYQFKRIYRFEEPKMQQPGEKVALTEFESIIFKLPSKKDTETLMIDPLTRNLYIVSKREEPVFVYEIVYPYSTSDTLLAREVLSLPLTQIVGGDISPDGKKVLLKNYEYVYYWDNPSGKSFPDVLRDKPLDVPYEEEPQGESITWARDGSGFYTLSEQSKTEKAYLFFYGRNTTHRPSK
ncbi:MAG TPA: hypothetical protein VD816_08160 [Ohtaekwangia sp.]|nr:hypothetical protein [Ohtaekwangia sp.]